MQENYSNIFVDEQHIISNKLTISGLKGHNYLLGYCIYRKSKCEVYNYVSPTLRILHMLNGRSNLVIDGNSVPFNQGDIAILSNINKRNFKDVYSEFIEYEMFDFYPSIFRGDQFWKVFYGSNHVLSYQSCQALPKIQKYLDILREEIQKDDDNTVLIIQGLIELLSIEFQRALHNNAGDIDHSLLSVSKSIQFISENLTGDLSVPKLADMCGYTPEHYSRLFKKYVGVSPSKYIINLRLDTTLHLAWDQKLSITNAALQSGFKSASAFYKSFHTYYGTTPLDYISSAEKKGRFPDV